MARAKSVASRKHRKILKKAKGFKQARSQRLKVAKEAILHAGQYAYCGRRLRRRDMRKLWVQRINAALSEYDLSYSKFIKLLRNANVIIDRKILAQLTVEDPETFKKIVQVSLRETPQPHRRTNVEKVTSKSRKKIINQ